jgi:general secretion pathway protein G
MFPQSIQFRKLHSRGFTLVELVVIIVVLGILAAFAIPKYSTITDSSKITATKEEMQQLKRAIIGSPTIVAGGALIDRGYLGDVGFVPSALKDLITKPDSVSTYNKLTRLGWNGPYIDSAQGGYNKDAWGTTYVYQSGSRRIVSVGGTDSIIVTF